MAYVDTSALVAYYCPEDLSGAAQTALRKLRAPTISWLVEVELCSALATKIRTRGIDRPTATRILSLFQQHRAEGYFTIAPIESLEYRLASDWIAQFSTALRTLDALHLAVAHRTELPLLTADQRLARAAKDLHVRFRLLG